MGLMGYTNSEGAILLSKAPGWRKVIAGLVWRYASDVPGRLRSMRSRRLGLRGQRTDATSQHRTPDESK